MFYAEKLIKICTFLKKKNNVFVIQNNLLQRNKANENLCRKSILIYDESGNITNIDLIIVFWKCH